MIPTSPRSGGPPNALAFSWKVHRENWAGLQAGTARRRRAAGRTCLARMAPSLGEDPVSASSEESPAALRAAVPTWRSEPGPCGSLSAAAAPRPPSGRSANGPGCANASRASQRVVGRSPALRVTEMSLWGYRPEVNMSQWPDFRAQHVAVAAPARWNLGQYRNRRVKRHFQAVGRHLLLRTAGVKSDAPPAGLRPAVPAWRPAFPCRWCWGGLEGDVRFAPRWGAMPAGGRRSAVARCRDGARCAARGPAARCADLEIGVPVRAVLWGLGSDAPAD